MLSKLALSLVAVCFLFSDANAQEGVRADRILTVRDLHGHCASSESTEAGRLSMGYCLGAITGIADASMTLNAVLSGKQTICLENADSADKMRLHFLRFVEQTPDVMDMPAATVVIAVLQSNFRCGVDQ